MDHVASDYLDYHEYFMGFNYNKEKKVRKEKVQITDQFLNEIAELVREKISQPIKVEPFILDAWDLDDEFIDESIGVKYQWIGKNSVGKPVFEVLNGAQAGEFQLIQESEMKSWVQMTEFYSNSEEVVGSSTSLDYETDGSDDDWLSDDSNDQRCTCYHCTANQY